MLISRKKSICIALLVSTGCLPFAILHAQTVNAVNSTVVYNHLGNITTDRQSGQYRYNPLNELISDWATNSKKIQYQYYTTGMQASESVELTTLYHYYAGHNQLLNSVQTTDFSAYLFAHGRVLRAYQSANGLHTQLYMRNRHHSVVLTMNSQAMQTHQYNAYGTMLLNEVPGSANSKMVDSISTSPLAYSNYLFDAEAGLYYLQARYYSPLYRTFLSRDNDNLENRYFYVNDNPILLSDPSGHHSSYVGVYLTVTILPSALFGLTAGQLMGYLLNKPTPDDLSDTDSYVSDTGPNSDGSRPSELSTENLAQHTTMVEHEVHGTLASTHNIGSRYLSVDREYPDQYSPSSITEVDKSSPALEATNITASSPTSEEPVRAKDSFPSFSATSSQLVKGELFKHKNPGTITIEKDYPDIVSHSTQPLIID